MKIGTPDHPKTRDLADRLSIPRYAAVGLLELLWHATAEYAIRGDIGRYTDAHIADLCHWPPDDAERLVTALRESGWVDFHPNLRLVIHDWADHADTYTNARLARGRLFFACGKAPNTRSMRSDERAEAQKWYAEHKYEDVVRDVVRVFVPPPPKTTKRPPRSQKAETPHGTVPALPLPFPSLPVPCQGGCVFGDFWDAWPKHHRKVNRKGCLKIWEANNLDSKGDQIMAALAMWKRSSAWADPADIIPMPATWLNQERWEVEDIPASSDFDDGLCEMRIPTVEEARAILESCNPQPDQNA